MGKARRGMRVPLPAPPSDGNLSQFYFGIDISENGSFIAIETPQATDIVSADLDLGPAALQLALFVNQIAVD